MAIENKKLPIPTDIRGNELTEGFYFKIHNVFGTDVPSLIMVVRKEGYLRYSHLLGSVNSLQYDETTRFYPINDEDIRGLPDRLSDVTTEESKLAQTVQRDFNLEGNEVSLNAHN